MVIRTSMHWWLLLIALPCVRGQDLLMPGADTSGSPALRDPSFSEKWDLFVGETVSPLTLGATGFNTTVSQLTHSAPLYGRRPWKNGAFAKRAGASLGDIVSQNFFGDFLLASAIHEDTRYVRMGRSRKLWPRIGYAISRAVITKTDTGVPTFNWANVVGCAMSAGLSNAYYPPASRTTTVGAVNWGTNIAGAGLTNLMPEFGSDVGHWLKRHLLPYH